MKVIVVGATGAAGHQVVLQCIETPQISSVVVLSRLPIDKALSQNPKVHVILNHNFLFYPPALLEQLKGSQCCIWCLAYRVQDFPEVETMENVILDFPLAAADAIIRKNISNGQKFHFVFCSGNSM
ncbi:hypothetical protein LTR10_017181 [Elasticomyces elasticus]|uniref:NAD(P)-binding domain-containing protein n=1 Tax=Exophiala sideris TaxID=1016849 RepID=A0ABR0J5M7_9EURO|nr:hypothetical protein LTR10_017181 [Elasticomyces elasticus]KAK5028463.1 hypothetical protein LTS07_006554 [Exophiala sideris]KAK5035895.1 hypothetical protein LTR13_005465 [Exophiala sideris]KAK5056931.1 hypothetical protein LTR69_007569 [Exophiala sideris]KAK5181338.1 hypothetical protein LTR44_006133 [Eurotiomycetes sp. CCFEE 6388]